MTGDDIAFTAITIGLLTLCALIAWAIHNAHR